MNTLSMARKKKDKTLNQQLAQAIIDQYQPQSVEDMQNALKDIFGPMFEAMLQGGMNSHLGYSNNERGEKETVNRRNGYTKKTLKTRVFGYKEVYLSIRRYSPVQGLCRLFLFIGFFLFRLRVSRQMDFSHEVKDNIHFLKTLAVYLLRRMDNDFLYKLIDDSGS